MHIENFKLKYNQTIVTWKWLHQHPMTNLAANRGAGMTSCHVLILFNLSSFQEEFTI
jgi:predicted FMN-binding regulatory protein PaiB